MTGPYDSRRSSSEGARGGRRPESVVRSPDDHAPLRRKAWRLAPVGGVRAPGFARFPVALVSVADRDLFFQDRLESIQCGFAAAAANRFSATLAPSLAGRSAP